MIEQRKLPNEIYTAEPLRNENSWRVVSNYGDVYAYRVSKDLAEKIASRLNLQ